MKIIDKTASLLVCLTLGAGFVDAVAAVSGVWTYEGKMITSYTGDETNVTIPASLDGNEITTVAGNVFASASGVQNIVVSEGITELMPDAFSGIGNLYSVSLPASIRAVGEVYHGMPIPVIHIPTLEAWMGIDFGGRLGNSTDLYVGGELLTSYYPEFQGEYELKPYAFYGIKSIKKSILISGTEIPQYAFANSGIDGIGLNDGLTIIGDHAFENCQLVEIQLPATATTIGNYAFASNSGLKSIILDKNLTTISEAAFSGINASAMIFSDADVPPVATGAFDDYLKLTATLYVPSESLEKYQSDWAFANTQSQNPGSDWTIDGAGAILSYNGAASEVVIPDYIGSTKVINIARELFMGNTSITEVVFPEGIGFIPERAFKDCVNLKKVVLGSNCQIISQSAFEGCKSLTDISLPDRVWEIATNAFAGCGLSQLIVPARLSSVGKDAFYECPIKNVYVSDLRKWLGIDFENAAANPLCEGAGLYVNGQELTTVATWEEVAVKPYAFYGLKSLTSVSLPAATGIGKYAFCNCENLTSVNIQHVGTIGNYAFWRCPLTGALGLYDIFSIGVNAFGLPEENPGLTELALGNRLSLIWEGAFLGHNNISRISANSLIPAELRSEKKTLTPVFEQSVRENATLLVPCGTSELYAYRWDFTNIKADKASSLKVLLPDNGSFSLIDPQEDTRVFIGSTDPEWELSAVYLGDEDIYETLVSPEGYWIITDIPEGETTLRVVLKKKIESGVTDASIPREDIKVRKAGDIITIEGASENAVVNVYDASGGHLLTTTSHSFPLQSQGVVIVNVDNCSFKFLN